MRIKKEAVRRVIRNFLFEVGSSAHSNVNYGIYDRPGPSWEGDQEEEEDLTVPAEVPLTPTEMMAGQLVDERPPIEDDEYVPHNPEELSRAAKAVAQLVPGNQVDFFYKNLHRLLDKSTEKENTPDLADNEEEGEKEEKKSPVAVKKAKEKNEARNRRPVRVLEQYGDEDDLQSYRYGSDVPEGYQEVDEPEFEEAAAAAAEASPSESDGKTFEELAGQFGFSGVPGVRQYIDRITSRMEHFVTKTKPEDVSMLQDRAVEEYVDLMLAEDLIDDDDAVELQQAPAMVKDLDSFRFFFVSGFVMPAYQHISRVATKRVKTELSSLGMPEKMHQTVMNQVTGKASRDRKAIEKKLSAAADESNMSPEDRSALSQKLARAFPSLKKLAELDEDLVKIGLSKWGSFSAAKKSDLIKQALGSTSDFQQNFEKGA